MIKSIRLTLLLLLLLSITGTMMPAMAQLQFPSPDQQFIVYYHHWPKDNDEFFRTMGRRYRLIILNIEDFDLPDTIKTDADKAEYRKARIRCLHDAGALVFAYLSVGEENIEGHDYKPYEGDGKGPCSSELPSSCHPKKDEKDKVASYYIGNKGGKVQGHEKEIKGKKVFTALFVNPGNASWKTMMGQKGQALLDLGCDGLFLDTVTRAMLSRGRGRGCLTC